MKEALRYVGTGAIVGPLLGRGIGELVIRYGINGWLAGCVITGAIMVAASYLIRGKA